MKIWPVFHVCLLEPYYKNSLPGRVVPPPPPVDVITDDESHQEHEVDEVLDSKMIRRKLHYYIACFGDCCLWLLMLRIQMRACDQHSEPGSNIVEDLVCSSVGMNCFQIGSLFRLSCSLLWPRSSIDDTLQAVLCDSRKVSARIDAVSMKPIADLPENEKAIITPDEGDAQAVSKEL